MLFLPGTHQCCLYTTLNHILSYQNIMCFINNQVILNMFLHHIKLHYMKYIVVLHNIFGYVYSPVGDFVATFFCWLHSPRKASQAGLIESQQDKYTQSGVPNMRFISDYALVQGRCFMFGGGDCTCTIRLFNMIQYHST